MCRIAAYLGPAAPLSALLSDPIHSLEVQSYLPRTMVSGHVNVDGTGLCWWPERGHGEPLRYVTERPYWSDPNLPQLAPRLCGAVQLAAVRSATPGMPFGPGAVGPFAADGLAFAHNGYVADFNRSIADRLTGELSAEVRAELTLRTDSTVLFGLVRDARRRLPQAPLVEALEAGVGVLAAAADAAQVPANLVCVASDGRELALVRRGVRAKPNTLHLLREDDACWVASEPLDDRRWEAVPPDTSLTLALDPRTSVLTEEDPR